MWVSLGLCSGLLGDGVNSRVDDIHLLKCSLIILIGDINVIPVTNPLLVSIKVYSSHSLISHHFANMSGKVGFTAKSLNNLLAIVWIQPKLVQQFLDTREGLSVVYRVVYRCGRRACFRRASCCFCVRLYKGLRFLFRPSRRNLSLSVSTSLERPPVGTPALRRATWATPATMILGSAHLTQPPESCCLIPSS